MDLDTDRLKKMMSYRYDPGRAAPSPTHQHFEEFRRKEFEAGDLAERYHENTKYTEDSHRSDGPTMSLFVRDETMQFAQARMRNDYADRETVELPEPAPELGADLGQLLSKRRSLRLYGGEPIDREEFSTLLSYAVGVNGRLTPGSDVPKHGRTYPSGGGLYPVEIYPVVLNGGPDLDEGLYYYAAEEHALRVLDREDPAGAIEEMFVPPEGMDPTEAAFCLLLTGAFWRTKAKYGPRGYRFVLQESGHLVQNVQLVALAMGYGSCPLGAVREDRANDFLDVDGVDEALVYTVFVGEPPRRPDDASGGGADG